METISNALFWISNGLMVPVVVILLLFLVQATVLVCGFFGEFLRRSGRQKRLKAILDGEPQAISGQLASLTSPSKDLFPRAIAALFAHKGDSAYRERVLAQYEVDATRELGGPRILAKVGPMLGLMGTLIPMGPALVGLASGDLASMAYNMQVAFATTVIGMLVAAVGVVTLQVKQRWLSGEMNDLEYINSVIDNEKE